MREETPAVRADGQGHRGRRSRRHHPSARRPRPGDAGGDACARRSRRRTTRSPAVDDAKLARALGDRSERLLGPLVERYPIVGEVLGRTRTPAWILAVLLLLAFASGIALSALDGSRRINILAFPFIGLIAWNLSHLRSCWRRLGAARRGRHDGAAAIAPLVRARVRASHRAAGEAHGPGARGARPRDRQLCRELGRTWAARSSRSTPGAGCTSRRRPSRSA